MPVVLVTNNPRLRTSLPEHIRPLDRAELHASGQTAAVCCLLDTSPLAVLIAGRDLIHAGWRLTHHPLYGNFRPHQQPYRSLLLESGPPASPARTDETSLHLIEEALTVYRQSSVLAPDDAPDSLKQACALIDCELMRSPLEQAGLVDTHFGHNA